jgi:L-ribulose-5-phosphate 3-epimerase UlaE
VLERVGSPWLQLYPDVGNLIERGLDPLAELDLARGRMVALHAKDARPGEPRRVPFGEGGVPFAAAFERLAAPATRAYAGGDVERRRPRLGAEARAAARAWVVARMARAGCVVEGA